MNVQRFNNGMGKGEAVHTGALWKALAELMFKLKSEC